MLFIPALRFVNTQSASCRVDNPAISKIFKSITCRSQNRQREGKKLFRWARHSRLVRTSPDSLRERKLSGRYLEWSRFPPRVSCSKLVETWTTLACRIMGWRSLGQRRWHRGIGWKRLPTTSGNSLASSQSKLAPARHRNDAHSSSRALLLATRLANDPFGNASAMARRYEVLWNNGVCKIGIICR